MTNDCNLRCIHCFRVASTHNDDELLTDEVRNVINQFKALGGEDLVISGGEPFLRSDILEILEHAHQHVKRVTVITNGTLIDKYAAEFLKRLEPISVQVSLDGATPRSNDRIRGDGAFERAIRGIKLLRQAEFTETLVTAMTLTKVNLSEVEAFIELAEELSIAQVHFPFFQAVGRGRTNRQILEPDIQQSVDAIHRIHVTRQATESRIGIPSIVDRVWGIREKRRDFCAAGVSGWSVEPDGSVTPCAGLSGPQHIAGSIRADSLREITHNSLLTK